MLIHCSSLANIMAMPRTGKGMSETAKSEVKKMILLKRFGFRAFLGNKQTEKGNACEDEAIALLGAVHFKKYLKHVGRVENSWLSGECDILHDHIHDVKCPWSLDSFPFFGSDNEAQDKAKKAGYDWQMRGYMMLYDRPVAHIHFVLLPTPHELLKFGDDEYMHRDCVEAVPLKHRIRTVTIERDLAIEEQIKERCEMAQAYAAQLIEDLAA